MLIPGHSAQNHFIWSAEEKAFAYDDCTSYHCMKSWLFVSVIASRYGHLFGCRIGLVFVVNDCDDIDGLQDAGVALLRVYNYVAQEMDNNYAFQTVMSVSIHLKQKWIFSMCFYVCKISV